MKPCRLLLVEDNEAQAELVREMLMPAPTGDYDIRWVTRLSQLGESAAAWVPDVVLVDLALPDSRGVETVAAVRFVIGAVPLVVLTGLDDDDLATQCLAAGADDYLWKGEIRPATLRYAITHAITRFRADQERERLKNELEQALSRVVRGLIPVCSHCRRVREGDDWFSLEDYLSKRARIKFSHGLCLECADIYFPKSENRTSGTQDRG